MKKAFIQIMALNSVVAATIMLYSHIVYDDSTFGSYAALSVWLLMFGLYNLGLGALLFVVSVGKKPVRPYVFSMIILALALLVLSFMIIGITRNSR